MERHLSGDASEWRRVTPRCRETCLAERSGGARLIFHPQTACTHDCSGFKDIMGAASLLAYMRKRMPSHFTLRGGVGILRRVWGYCADASLRIREPFRSEVPPRCGASGRRRAGSAGSIWIRRRSRAPPRGPSSSGSSCSGAPPTGATRCEDDFSVGDSLRECYVT